MTESTTTNQPTTTQARVYPPTQDWAGIGRPHGMIAWNDPDGTPRSVVID